MSSKTTEELLSQLEEICRPREGDEVPLIVAVGPRCLNGIGIAPTVTIRPELLN
jgi:hypothetical protein